MVLADSLELEAVSLELDVVSIVLDVVSLALVVVALELKVEVVEEEAGPEVEVTDTVVAVEFCVEKFMSSVSGNQRRRNLNSHLPQR